MKKEKDTYTELFKLYSQALYRYLYRMCGSREIAEELLQETFYRSMLSLRRQHLYNAKAWLYKVARHLYIDWQRKHSTEQKAMQQFEELECGISTIPSPEDALDGKEQRRQIEEILLCLPEHYRTVVYLREVDGFSYAELADLLGITMDQVKINLHRGRKRFREIAVKLERRDIDG
ncbi:RNA polymerase sigma factor [Paenibacillus pinihumi]|uniref:RNA polymerase sigma factor n=1 Tax=Paenibacillus pinihumi TaxID=669462 RepID=UPI000418741D|nr:sigma-70 family RNA polymerase sigma factor [Paenibacillus pinihumi]